MRQADQSTDNASANSYGAANSTGDLVLDTECLLVSRTVSKEFQKDVYQLSSTSMIYECYDN